MTVLGVVLALSNSFKKPETRTTKNAWLFMVLAHVRFSPSDLSRTLGHLSRLVWACCGPPWTTNRSQRGCLGDVLEPSARHLGLQGAM